MAIEIVDLAIENGDFQELCEFTRVSSNGLKLHVPSWKNPTQMAIAWGEIPYCQTYPNTRWYIYIYVYIYIYIYVYIYIRIYVWSHLHIYIYIYPINMFTHIHPMIYFHCILTISYYIHINGPRHLVRRASRSQGFQGFPVGKACRFPLARHRNGIS